MKNIKNKLGKLLAALLVASLFVTGVACGVSGNSGNGGSGNPSNPGGDNAGGNKDYIDNLTENEQALFSFESYDDMHSVMKKTYNRLGVLNFSDEHVTHGLKSLKLDVWGEYNTTDRPGMDLYCTNSDFVTGNFSNLASLKMDVYNAQDKALRMGISFNVTLKSDYTKKGNTPLEFFTLAPNATTTIEYEIPNLVSVCDMQKVNYVHVEFDKAKNKREDPAHVFYIDNLRGVKLSEARPDDQGDSISFTKGFTFENLAEVMLMPTFDGFDSSWAKYEVEGVEAPAELELGSYGMKLVNPSNKLWPGFTIDFGETFKAGTTITFRTYIAAADGVCRLPGSPFFIEAFSDTAKTKRYTVQKDAYALNTWVEISITFESDSPKIWFFYNFHNGSSSTMNSADYAVYMDNFKVNPAA